MRVPATTGDAAGLVDAVALTNGFGGLFFGVSPSIFRCSPAPPSCLWGWAALASDGPARRAASVDPVATLHAE